MEDRWNAFVPYPRETVQNASTGPLVGLSLAVKDIFDVAGYPTGAGNPAILAASGIKTQTAPLVRTLLEAGANFVGKANTDELAYSLIGDNIHFGMPVNPRYPDRISGGSSSGSAVAVAADLADIGLGTDTSGSVRLPAAVNGIVGWRATHGSLDVQGLRPLAPSFDVPGFLTTRLEPMVAVMNALDLPAVAAGPSSIVISEDILGVVEAGFAEQVVLHAGRAGRPVRSIPKLTSLGLDDLAATFVTILQAEAWESNRALFERHGSTIAPGIADRLRLGATLKATAVSDARRIRNAFRKEMAEVFASGALFALPTLAMEAPQRDATAARLAAFRSACIRLLCLAGLGGYPQLSFPASGNGREFSLSLIGPAGSDRLLIETALRLRLTDA